MKRCGKSEVSGRMVGQLLKKPLENLIPALMIGGQKNKKRCVLNIIKSFTYGCKDVLPIKMFIKGIQFKNIQWLNGTSDKCSEFKSICTAKLLLWLWRISKKLVASQYYISEKQGYNNKLVFFEKSAWQKSTDKAFKKLVSQGSFKHLELDEANCTTSVRKRARLRWLPKEQGLRPIISVR